MRLEGEKLLCKWFNRPPPEFDPFGSGVVDRSRVDQRWGQGEKEVWLVLGRHVPAGHLAEVAGPAADLGVLVAGPAVAAGLQLPVVAAAVGVAVDLLPQPLA